VDRGEHMTSDSFVGRRHDHVIGACLLSHVRADSEGNVINSGRYLSPSAPKEKQRRYSHRINSGVRNEWISSTHIAIH
jgi:hypothetical protein